MKLPGLCAGFNFRNESLSVVADLPGRKELLLKRRLYQLDVFTSKAYEGNPLAVVTDGDEISKERMQDVAREMNLSETVFVQRPTNNRALARLRIFTTTQELPLAGHPVIGTWFLLAQLGVVPASEGQVRILQQTGAGILPVELSFHEGRPVRVTMTQKPAQFRATKISRKALAVALGLKAGDIDADLPIESVSTGIFNLMVPIASRKALGKISMNLAQMAKFMRGVGQMAYCFVLGGTGQAFSRGMLPWGMIEDPATGSAGGSLGAYLVRHGKLKIGEQLKILQGVEMKRPSHIEVVVDSARGKFAPRVSGSAVCILEGHIEA
jgi:trans-2,3-dihydro-3-hydroxyanthranilate isomerase